MFPLDGAALLSLLFPGEVALPWLLPALVLLEASYLGTAALAVLLGGRPPLRGLGPPSGTGAGLPALPAAPVVSCIVTCYAEGGLVRRTLESLLDQDYEGRIEVIAVIDGAAHNAATLQAVLALESAAVRPGRDLRLLPKWMRGGRASSLNTGLAVARGDIVLALDGDTSFDRDMVRKALRRFREPGVVAVAGTLRVRNLGEGLATRLQGLDYLIFRQFIRAGLGVLNTPNNIPGAHGAFRRDVLLALGGWDNGTAEDVDLSLRLRKCLGRHPGWRIAAGPDVISHTDVPARWGEFLRQRLRWEGDPVYLFLRKHGPMLRPRLLGWRNYVFALWYGVLFQIFMPLLYLLALLLLLAGGAASGPVLALAYGLYLCLALALFAGHLALTSERRVADARLGVWLPLYPGFVLLLRAWSGVAVLHSLLARSHRDTSMAPWWVLRKSRY